MPVVRCAPPRERSDLCSADPRHSFLDSMLSVMALSSSALIVGLRPAVQPVTVRAMASIGSDSGGGVSLRAGGGLAPPGAETLADQYRNRWAGDDGLVRSRPHTVGDASSGAFSGDALSDVVAGDSGPAPVSKGQTVGEASSNAFAGAPLTDVVCIVADDGEEVCGPASFDSVEGGVVCVETEDGEQVCA